MSLKLHVFPLSTRAFKVLWAANHLGLDYELSYIDLTKGEQKREEFLALNPNGKMPVLEHDGFSLWESNAIVNYLSHLKPDAGLLPSDVKARIKALQWQFWDSTSWDPACAMLVFERVVKRLLKLGEPNPAEIERGEAKFATAAHVLDGQLQKHRYVAGDKLTVADFSVGAALNAADAAQYPLQPYRAIARWHTELKAMPAWSKTTALQMSKAA
jgi:glutathione S-transferase